MIFLPVGMQPLCLADDVLLLTAIIMGFKWLSPQHVKDLIREGIFTRVDEGDVVDDEPEEAEAPAEADEGDIVDGVFEEI